MKRLFIILLLLPLFGIGQINFTFTPNPNDFLNADRGAHLWINRDAPYGTIDIPVNDAPQPMMDFYYRFSLPNFFTGIGTDSTINYTFFRSIMGQATAKHMGIRFRIMSLCNNCGTPPGDNGNSLVAFDGGVSSYPEFLHELMQAEPIVGNRDFFSTVGDNDGWVFNVNSPQYRRWVRKFSQQLRNYIDTAVINGQPLRYAIRVYDLGFYGCYSEQHQSCLCTSNINDGNIPAGALHTVASLNDIVDAQLDGMGGNPNWKYVVPMNAFDAIWLSHTFNPVAYAQYLLDHPDSISVIDDHIGANESYDHDYLELNFRIGSGYNAKLMNRWKYSPWGGEPVGWGSPADRSAIPQYVQFYHMSWFGNGNLDHIAANGADDNGWPTEANNIRTASRLAGYRLRLTGGSANAGASLVINLNWLNEGNAPVYFDWDVKYLIKNGAGTTVSTLNSNFDVRYFQPSGSPVTHTQTFGIPAIPVGTYGLYVKVVDPNGYRYPMRLAITPAQADTSYFLGNITLGGGTNLPPVANAGPNQSTTASSTTLTSTGSSDPDGTIVSFLWSAVPGGPNTPTIVSPTSASTSVTGLIPGVYQFDLTVTDNLGATGSDQVQVTVNAVGNQAPVAVITTGTPTIQLPINTVNLSGTSSTDDVGVTGYLWSQVSGPSTATIATPTASTTDMNNLVQGVYFFQLQVSDAGSLTDTDQIMITVNAADAQPRPLLDGRPLFKNGVKFLPRIP